MNLASLIVALAIVIAFCGAALHFFRRRRSACEGCALRGFCGKR